MSNYVLLNNIEHFKLKAQNQYFKEAGDNQPAVMTFPTEFSDIQREYPILLRKDSESGEFQAVALLGVKKDENLFLADEQVGGDLSYGWNGYYVPAIVARGPFILGMTQQQDGTTSAQVFVDLDSPKVSEEEGVDLFLEHGGNSEYLDYIVKVLGTIQRGKEVGRSMFKAFDELGLIEPLTINVDLKDGERIQVAGYFTVNEDKLNALPGKDLELLNKAGFLQGAFLIISSPSNLQKLIEIKNSRL